MMPLVTLTFLGNTYNDVQSAIIITCVLGFLGILFFVIGKLISVKLEYSFFRFLRWIFYIPLVPIVLFWIWTVGFQLFSEGMMAVMEYIIHSPTLVILTAGFLASIGILPKTLSSISSPRKPKEGSSTVVTQVGDKYMVGDKVYLSREDAERCKYNQ